jgi:superfamily II DNA or RNA helicase
MPDRAVLSSSYSDNDQFTVAARLVAEVNDDPTRLWVASGYFAPSVWGAIGSALSRLGEFRLLLGKDYEMANLERGREELRIAQLVARAIQDETQPPRLATRDEAEAVAELVEFIEHQRRGGEPVVKLWEGEGFLHAKAYLLGRSVGIGSANFTGNGLTRNRELVGWRQDRTVVEEVEGWFSGYWSSDHARDYTDDLIGLLRATPLVSDEYTPHELLIRVLAERYGVERQRSLEQANFSLRWFQEDAAFRLVRLLNGRARGALLADAVGLGKTYVAMAVIHHYLYAQAEARRGRGRPVLVIAPASLQAMWRGVLDASGLTWACDIVTTQTFRGDHDVRQYHGADLVVIDEAHRLRGGGTWFHKIIDLVSGGDRADERRVLLLTATPVNTGISDLVNLLRVLTKNSRSVWAPEIADYERYLRRVERGEADPFPVLDRSIVRRSRSDIIRAQDEARAAGLAIEPVALPERRAVHVDHGYGGEGDLFDEFAGTLRSLVLAPYDLERFRLDQPEEPERSRLLTTDGSEIDVEDRALNLRPGTMAALCASGLLVRFQSSLAAIRRSLNRVEAVQRRYSDALALDPPRLLDLQGSPQVRRLLQDEATGADRDDIEEPDDAAELDSAWHEVFAGMPVLEDAEFYDLGEIHAAIVHDRAHIASLLAALPSEESDGKIGALLSTLGRSRANGKPGAPGLAGRRVLIFSQFRDTARYVHRRLQDSGFAADLIDGGVASTKRVQITAWFDPDRADARETEGRAAGEEPPQILVSTDVLAEGHNLQLADTVMNFDLHFNPQVAVQRAGRVDRIGSPHRTVYLVSFLPPGNLDRHIGLLARLDERFRRIHGLGLGDEQVTPLTADRQVQTLEQIRRLYADDVSVLDEVERTWTLGSTDYMRQPLEAFLAEAGMESVGRIPVGVSSVRRLPVSADWPHGNGAFLALAGPRGSSGERDTYWRFYPRGDDRSWDDPITDEVTIFRAIACRRIEPRGDLPWTSPGPTVIDWDLLRRAAAELAGQLTVERSTAAVAAGASERSRALRTELRGGLEGLDVDRADELLQRLLQVRVEDFDGRSGWSRFSEARRVLKRATTLGERREVALTLIDAGLDLFGAPVPDSEGDHGRIEVSADEIQLVAYEALVMPEAKPQPQRPVEPDTLFPPAGDQQRPS